MSLFIRVIKGNRELCVVEKPSLESYKILLKLKIHNYSSSLHERASGDVYNFPSNDSFTRFAVASILLDIITMAKFSPPKFTSSASAMKKSRPNNVLMTYATRSSKQLLYMNLYQIMYHKREKPGVRID